MDWAIEKGKFVNKTHQAPGDDSEESGFHDENDAEMKVKKEEDEDHDTDNDSDKDDEDDGDDDDDDDKSQDSDEEDDDDSDMDEDSETKHDKRDMKLGLYVILTPLVLVYWVLLFEEA